MSQTKRSNSSLPLRKQLAAYDVPEVAHFLPIDRYYALAKGLHEQALKAVASGDLVLSYKYLHNVVTLINDRITRHQNYSQHNPNRLWGVRTSKACLELLEEVVTRMDRAVDEQIRQEQQRKLDEYLIDVFDGDTPVTEEKLMTERVMEHESKAAPVTNESIPLVEEANAKPICIPEDPYPPLSNSSEDLETMVRAITIPKDATLCESVPNSVVAPVAEEAEYQYDEDQELLPNEKLYPRIPGVASLPHGYSRFAGLTVPDIEITQKIMRCKNFAIPHPYVANYELKIGRESFLFQMLDFHVTFNNFLKDMPAELQMAKTAVEVNRCFFLHLGVAANIHPFLLQVVFRNITANRLGNLSTEDIEYAMLETVKEYAGLVDANTLAYLWPEEFRQTRICIIAGPPGSPSLSCFCCEEINMNAPVMNIIMRCERSHFTLLKPLGDARAAHSTFDQLIVDAKRAGLVVQQLMPRCSYSVTKTIDYILGRM